MTPEKTLNKNLSINCHPWNHDFSFFYSKLINCLDLWDAKWKHLNVDWTNNHASIFLIFLAPLGWS